jgi:hypothetical protein
MYQHPEHTFYELGMGCRCPFCGAKLQYEYPKYLGYRGVYLDCEECPNKEPIEDRDAMEEAGWMLRVEKVQGTGQRVWLWMLCTEHGAQFRDDRDGHEWFEPDL